MLATLPVATYSNALADPSVRVCYATSIEDAMRESMLGTCKQVAARQSQIWDRLRQ